MGIVILFGPFPLCVFRLNLFMRVICFTKRCELDLLSKDRQYVLPRRVIFPQSPPKTSLNSHLAN